MIIFWLNFMQNLTFATRTSNLARWQTRWVIQALEQAYPSLVCAERSIITQGDRILDQPLPLVGGKGLFTLELEAELLADRVQAAVHSLKDLPVAASPGLVIAAIPKRKEVRDALVSKAGYTLETLPTGSRVGTSSLRRAAQVLSLRPDLVVVPLRGNIETRLRKADEGLYEAIILAGAALERLNLAARISQWLPLETMLPAPGQGALAVQCTAVNQELRSLLASIDDPATRSVVTAERAFLSHLGGGCALPVGAYGQVLPGEHGGIRLDGLVASPDGSRIIRVSSVGMNPDALGKVLAEKALAAGASVILAKTMNDN